MSFRTKQNKRKKKLGNANKGERRKEEEGLFPMRKLTVTVNFDLFLFCTSPPLARARRRVEHGRKKRGRNLGINGRRRRRNWCLTSCLSVCDSGRSV